MLDPKVIRNLQNGGWQTCKFEPFRDGIEISWLVTGEPSAALLKYEAGACVPLHKHAGLEVILILQGSQTDERGTYYKGDLIINPKETQHSVHSSDGCVIFIQWQKPVEFL